MARARKKILVTGATGFIGSRIVRKLCEAGHEVKLFCRPGSLRGALAGVPAGAVEVAEGDITVGHTIYRALAGCDRMFHVAATVKMWSPDPRCILEPAVIGMREALEAARRRDLDKVVVTSSAVTLGSNPDPEPLDESREGSVDGAEHYARAKLESEKIARSFANEGMPIVIVNPTVVVGPHDVRPSFAGRMLLRYLHWRMPIGFPCQQGGTNVVDVDDCAEGHVLAMERGAVGQRYILGGENLTYRQILELLAEITGLPGPSFDTPRALAMALGCVLETKARLFGGEPLVTYRLARDTIGSFLWVTSHRAERSLGYRHRSARRTLMRSVRYYLEHGFVTPTAARRIRLDLRAIA